MFLLPIAAFLGIALLLSGLYLMTVRGAVGHMKEQYRSIAANQSSIIQGAVDTALARAHTLSALVASDGGETDAFDLVAHQIYDSTTAETGVALKNIALAPGGVVEKVYPLEGNEALMGFSFLDPDKPGNLEAIAAYHRGEMVLTAPFELVQGGIGMGGRLPVFLPRNGETVFWGLVTVTLDFDTLLEALPLENLNDMGVNYRLWYKGPDGEPVVLAGSDAVPDQPVSYAFPLRNLTWHMDVAPADGWVDHMALAVAFAIILGVSLLLAMLLLAQERIRQANEQLQRIAHLDGLTACYSRHYVNSILIDQRTGRWNDPNMKFSLAMIDIDDFKGINDRFGHEMGDRAILAVAQVLLSHGRPEDGDCVIRFGGDEFIALFNDVTQERFLSKLQSIVEDVRHIRFPDQPELRLTVSAGGEAYVDPEWSLYYDMVRRTDEKLYLSKENGRDRLTV